MNYEAILAEAHTAAEAAVKRAALTIDEMSGACGFAWATIDGNDPLARHCRKALKIASGQVNGSTTLNPSQYGDRGYPKGWQFWNPGNYRGQNVDIKEEGAKAFRDALAAYGIRCDIGSRLD